MRGSAESKTRSRRGEEDGAESGGGHAGEFAEGAREVALVGEAGGEADFSERGVRREHAFASRANAQPMDVVGDTFAHTAAKDAGEVDRMDTGFASQFVEGEAATMLGLEFIENASKPAWGLAALALGRARGTGENFGEKAFDGEFVG